MASLLSVAATMAALYGAGTIERAQLPIGGFQYHGLTYRVRAVYAGAGLGGQNPYCAPDKQDLLLIVYTIRNDSGADMSAPAAPRLALFSPEGTDIRPDAMYTQAVTNKIAPPLMFKNGRLRANEVVLLADVFLTPRESQTEITTAPLRRVTSGGWKLRLARGGVEIIDLPNPSESETLECPRAPDY